jgi:mannose-6-phosphate isomerase
VTTAALARPLAFVPVYKKLVWGGRRMEAWRHDLPPGPIGESWDLSDHAEGMSLVSDGANDAIAGRSLADLVTAWPEALVGKGFAGRAFPLLIKLIDAADRLSVQVHPDDAIARRLGLADGGKTECWRILADGGSIYQGTRPGIDRAAFERGLADGTVAGTLNRYEAKAGDFFFLEARTVHALGKGCLLYEIQQTSNVTFRVHDWGRVGLDGKPRPLHVAESLETIDFSRTGFGPRQPPWLDHPAGGTVRLLCDSKYFRLEERQGSKLGAPGGRRCSVVICIEGRGTLATAGGTLSLATMQTALVPASAGPWTFEAEWGASLLVAEPHW